ncbi:hypothetical protein RJT34_25155 [Clitoria ternatea]|uniref:Uncharacterized protein n=1 Tax=Clitoria ternatea TaxID=43366 RepID=A0AAN9FW23_CLITE
MRYAPYGFIVDRLVSIAIMALIAKQQLSSNPPTKKLIGGCLVLQMVAGKAKVLLFSYMASEFVELFMGVDVSRVEALFKKTKSKELVGPNVVVTSEGDNLELVAVVVEGDYGGIELGKEIYGEKIWKGG